MVIHMLQVLSTSIDALLDVGSTLSFLTLLVAITFEIFPELLHDAIVVIKPLGENVRNDRVPQHYLIVARGKTM